MATDAKGVNSSVAFATLAVTAPPKLNTATTTGLSYSVTVAYGFIELVTLTATVDAAAGQPSPTGTVNFTVNGKYMGCGKLVTNKADPSEAIATIYLPNCADRADWLRGVHTESTLQVDSWGVVKPRTSRPAPL